MVGEVGGRGAQQHLHMEMGLPSLLRVFDALLENILSFLHKLAVKINGILSYAPRRIVFSKDELGGLLVVLVAQLGMLLGLLGEVVGGTAVTALVGFLGAMGERLLLRMLLTGKVAQAIILALGIGGCVVVESWLFLAG